MRAIVLGVALLLGGCRALLDYDQCNIDSDCQQFLPDGGTAFCTSDHICVSDSCSVDTIVSPASYDVTIAGLFSLTGPNGAKDAAIRQAAELAVGEINQGGGRRVRFVVCDTAGAADQSRIALTAAVEKFGAVASVGPNSSSEVIALVSDGENLVKKYGTLIVSSGATSPAITSLDDDGLIWRTCASDTLQGQVLATLVATGTTTIDDAYVDDSYGMGLNGSFMSSLGSSGLTVQSARGFPEGTAGASILSFLQAAQPQYALVVADDDAPSWIAALSTGSFPSTHFLLTDGSKSPQLFQSIPSPAFQAQITGTAPGTPSGPVFTAFQSDFMGAYKVDPSATAFTANTYDSVYAIAIAMGAVQGPLSGSLIAMGMGFLSTPGAPAIDVGPLAYTQAYQTLAPPTSGSVNLQGASGPIDFDSSGDIKTGPIEVWQIADVSGAPPNVTTSFATVKTVTP